MRALERREAGDVGVGGVDEEQVDALFAEARERAEVGEAAVERQLVHLEVAGGEHECPRAVRIATASASGIEWLTAMNSRSNGPICSCWPSVTVSVYGLMRCSLSFASMSASVRPEPIRGMSLLELEQVRHRADVVLVAVREHDADDVVEPVLDRLEVGQDQVDAGLVLLGEEHAAVDDEELAVDTRRRSCCGRPRRGRRAG